MESMRGEVSYQPSWLKNYNTTLPRGRYTITFLLTHDKIQFEQLHLTPSHFAKPALKSAIVLQYFKGSHTSLQNVTPSCLNDFKARCAWSSGRTLDFRPLGPGFPLRRS